MRPRIGVTSGATGVPVAEGVLPAHYVGQGYTRSVLDAGGVPIMLAAVPGYEDQVAEDVIDVIDGLVLSGGTDIHPTMYGADLDTRWTHEPDSARDRFEKALLMRVRERDIPVLGICRGLQMMNVAYGGTLDQHRPHESEDLAPVEGLRVQKTRVTIDKGTRTFAMLGRPSLDVYCLHHQALDALGEGLRVSAHAADGMIEAVEDPEAAFAVGLLWHPEQMVACDGARLPYEALVKAARRRVA